MRVSSKKSKGKSYSAVLREHDGGESFLQRWVAEV